MLWVVAIITVIFLAFGAAGLRAALKAGVAIILVGAVLIGGYLIFDSLETSASKRRIPVSDLTFDELRLNIGTNGKLTGTVHNLSKQYTLSSAELQITVRDCLQDKCDVVGQDTTTLYGLSVPPGQIRAVDQYVYFSALPAAHGEYKWDYAIKGTEGR